MAGSVGLLILDATALTNVALIAPGLAWPFLAAALASLTRIGRPCASDLHQFVEPHLAPHLLPQGIPGRPAGTPGSGLAP
jgi:hypothetical protein